MVEDCEPELAAGWECLVIWEFQVTGEMEARFRETYGPAGPWARFFSTDPAYLG
jgi:hypothetical protein